MSSGCGCNDHDHDHNDADETITLTLDDGSEVVCEVLGNFNLEGVDYIALMPEDDDEVLIYRYKQEGDQIALEAIESDEEFNTVSEAFDELFCEEEDFDDESDDDIEFEEDMDEEDD